VSAYPKAVAAGWHPVAAVSELRRKPLARQLMDRPIVVFAGAEGPAVLLDRCPHRNMALSEGHIRDGTIECPYHGWRFRGDGRCASIPGAEGGARPGAEALPAIVRAGLIWTTLNPSPSAGPNLPFPLEAEGFDSFLWPVKPSRARVLDAVENLLDPAHPHFLHTGIVRSGAVRRPVTVTVRTWPTHAEASYREDARPSALMPRMLEGERANSVGRFFPPSTGQVAFEGPSGLKLAVTVFFTPESPERVRPIAHLATPRGRAPAWIKQIALRAFDAVILAQDQAALARHAANVARFGGIKYALGPLDVLFPAIQALANGDTPEPTERIHEMRL
jgi:phenylpropionate dioxygenase-like ring-hydroxylating dioxygenase large terminal subunit